MYSFGELLWRDQSIPVSAPVLEVSLLGRTVVRVAAGGFHCGALSEQGNIFMWGENTAGQCGLTERDAVTNVTGWSTPYLLSSFLPSFFSYHIPSHPLLALLTIFFPHCLHPSLHSCNPLLRSLHSKFPSFFCFFCLSVNFTFPFSYLVFQ